MWCTLMLMLTIISLFKSAICHLPNRFPIPVCTSSFLRGGWECLGNVLVPLLSAPGKQGCQAPCVSKVLLYEDFSCSTCQLHLFKTSGGRPQVETAAPCNRWPWHLSSRKMWPSILPRCAAGIAASFVVILVLPRSQPRDPIEGRYYVLFVFYIRCLELGTNLIGAQ